MRVWKTGEAVRITYEGRTVEGTVLLASRNGTSLFLEFDALLGGYAGRMPVSVDDDGVIRDLMNNLPVELSPLEVS